MRLRASTKTQKAKTPDTFVLDRPAGTQAGDLLWVAFWQSYQAWTKPPPGFDELLSQFTLCGTGGSTLQLFSHVATANEPASYTFTLTRSEVISAVMAAFSGVATDEPPMVADNAREVVANPFAPPTMPPLPYETYALSTLWLLDKPSAAVTTPPGSTLLAATGGVAMFGRTAAADQAFDFGPSVATPDGCGWAHVALLRVR